MSEQTIPDQTRSLGRRRSGQLKMTWSYLSVERMRSEQDQARLLWRARRRVFKRVENRPPGGAVLEQLIQACMVEIQAEDAKGETACLS